MSQAIIDRATRVLDGVEQIARNEMLVHGRYITPEIVKPDKANAVCGGRQACLIGSVALAGAKGDYAVADELLSALLYTNRETLNRRPHVALALRALNAAATDRLRRARKTGREPQYLAKSRRRATKRRAKAALAWEPVAEGYFEAYLAGLPYNETRRAVVALCESAKRRLPKLAAS